MREYVSVEQYARGSGCVLSQHQHAGSSSHQVLGPPRRSACVLDPRRELPAYGASLRAGPKSSCGALVLLLHGPHPPRGGGLYLDSDPLTRTIGIYIIPNLVWGQRKVLLDCPQRGVWYVGVKLFRYILICSYLCTERPTHWEGTPLYIELHRLPHNMYTLILTFAFFMYYKRSAMHRTAPSSTAAQAAPPKPHHYGGSGGDADGAFITANGAHNLDLMSLQYT